MCKLPRDRQFARQIPCVWVYFYACVCLLIVSLVVCIYFVFLCCTPFFSLAGWDKDPSVFEADALHVVKVNKDRTCDVSSRTLISW